MEALKYDSSDVEISSSSRQSSMRVVAKKNLLAEVDVDENTPKFEF